MRRRTTLSLSAKKLIDSDDASKVWDKFLEDIDLVYEEAMNKHKNISSGEIPFYMWVLLAFFASDNIMGWLSSPILFYPLVLLAGVAVILNQLGILGILVEMGMPAVRGQVNNILAKTPLPFRL